MVVKIKGKNQVTIPSKLIKLMNLSEGDYLEIEETEGKLMITPIKMIKQEVINDVKNSIIDYKNDKSNYKKFDKVDDLISELDE